MSQVQTNNLWALSNLSNILLVMSQSHEQILV